MKMTSATVFSRSGRVLAVGVETGAELGAESDGAGSGAPEAVGVCWDRDVREVLMAGSVRWPAREPHRPGGLTQRRASDPGSSDSGSTPRACHCRYLTTTESAFSLVIQVALV